MFSLKRLGVLVIGGALVIPSIGHAEDPSLVPDESPANSSLLMGPGVAPAASTPDQSAAAMSAPDAISLALTSHTQVTGTPRSLVTPDGTTVYYLDDATSAPSSGPAPAPPTPNIHGFIEYPFTTAYITPRGLVVANEGLVMQPVAGFVLPIGDIGPIKNFTLATGVWNSINTHQHDPTVGAWNELDYFVTASADVGGGFSVAYTYSPWNSPPHAFATEHTNDVKVSYNDGQFFDGNFGGFHPYVDYFYELGGPSTVILGRNSGVGYFEPGIAPSYTLKFWPSYPITLSLPTYIHVGESGYWNSTGKTGNTDTNNFGVFSTGLDATVPLSFIPVKYGFWHLDAAVQYYNLLNGELVNSGTLASGNKDRNKFRGTVGIGVGF